MSYPIADYYAEKAVDLEEAKVALRRATEQNNTDEMFNQIQRVEYLTYLISKTGASKIRTVDSISPPSVIEKPTPVPEKPTPVVEKPTPVPEKPTLPSKKSSSSWISKIF